MTTRLIERYLPIAEIGIESVRERTPMTPFPAPNRLHVWWARRPLVASRAAVLASILPEDADRDAFKHALGIHGDPIAARVRIARADRQGERLGANAYGYPRAFLHNPTEEELGDLLGDKEFVVLDPTAGGGAIPFEAYRLGLSAAANDLNPVASLIEKATIEYPAKFGAQLLQEYEAIGPTWASEVRARLTTVFPAEPEKDCRPDAYLWARTIACPYCAGQVPLSPNWRLAPDGTGVAIVTHLASGVGDTARHCTFKIVDSSKDHAPSTIAGGDGICPFPDCGRPIDGDEIKRQAQAGGMGEQLFTVVYKRQVITKTKTGKNRMKWVRGYRAPTANDDNRGLVATLLSDKLPEWEAMDIVPNEAYPENTNDDRPRQYGMPLWRDMFSPRQLLAHGVAVEVFQEMLEADRSNGSLTEVRAMAYVYVAIGMDKLRDYNSRMTRWIVNRETLANTFDRHDFAFKWSYAEMALLIEGMGFDWAIEATGKSLRELIGMVGANKRGDMLDAVQKVTGTIAVTNGSGASMPHIADRSVDAVVMDPPYGANVMYAELSDFFYVWLKRTAGLVVPELFTRRLADKESEAVANKTHFQGQKGAAKLANRDYQDKMAGIFAECRRVLKDDGIMTVMFTHKDTGAWDALAMSLMHAGFVITASWPVNTEASGSLHIKDKAAANSTIFLVCRPRIDEGDEANYWEDVEPLVAKAVRERIGDFQIAGITGVDLYLASFGPALEAFSRHWPLTRGNPAPLPPAKRGSQGDLLEEFDPYAVRPEDALNAARREVKAWRLAQLADRRAANDMDPATAWVALAWDAFRAPQFAYDEGLRLARAVGLDMTQVVGRLAEKKGSDLKLWDSATRVAKGALGPANGSRGMIDALHHAAQTAQKTSVEAARDMLEANGLLDDDEFKVALEVLLEVLPPSKTFSGIEADDAIKPAADDFDALEKLRRIVYGDEIGAPKQLSLYDPLDA
ncbi:hypothetical protein NS355_08100 [Sphingomonas yabuuchiae]|uniref:DUF1156 domain-containing protein n=1 Tax=Sphingomonas yabuuchiae TaxID=172044 RepID=A0A147ITT2_9SPHN|nr:DUF1156 domain-containing protein [Sphingomonas yabuuchiae]KTT98878.1 hypothetical protein NS355_08100 [Sphingomonas yabuuchiae]